MKEKPTSRDLQAQETKRKLLRTSMELITKEGYHNVTIHRICGECGVSVGTFYQYFTSKRDIITLINREHNENLSRICRIEPGKSAVETYHEYVRKYMEYIAVRGTQESRILLQGMVDEKVRDEEAGIDLLRDFMEKLLAYGRETGEFDPAAMSDQDFFDLFVVGISGVLVTWLCTDGTMDIIEYGCRNLDWMIQRIIKRP